MAEQTKEGMETCPKVSFDEFPLPTYEQWKEACEKLLKGAPFEKKMVSKTYEGLTLKAMYWKDDLDGLPVTAEVPGLTPYTRGTCAEGYARGAWVIAQGAESHDLSRAHEALLDDLNRGGEGVYLTFDESTRRLTDEPQHLCPRALRLDGLADLETLLEGVESKTRSFYLDAGAEGFALYAALLVWAKGKGIDEAELKGFVAGDPVGEWVRWGKSDDRLEALYDRAAAAARLAAQKTPELRTLLVDGTVYESAGANAVSQLAALVSVGLEHLSALTERGLSLKQACSQLAFKVPVGANFFMEIAKLRALRRLWATAVAALGGDENDQRIEVMASTSAFTLTTYDPYVNLLRSSTQIFSAVVGGVDALHVHPFDAALRESTPQAARIARNQQIMFKTEFDMLTPVDPAGGSWYVERLTEELGQAAWKSICELDEAGGIFAALRAGTFQQAVNDTLAARFKALASRKDKAVGVNMYANMTEEPLTDERGFDAAARADEQRLRVETYKTKRGSLALDLSQFSVEKVCEALERGATFGELGAALGRQGGDEIAPLPPRRWTEQFEALRDRTRAHLAAGGENVRVFLANMGPVPQHKPRADFSRGFFEVGQFEVIGNNGFATVDEAAEAALASGAGVVVICSTDATYPELVPDLARKLKAARPQLKVILAGAPAPEFKGAYLEAGVDEFIHVKADCLSLLTRLQDERGMAR